MIKSYQYKGKTYYLIQLSIIDKKGKRHQPKYRVDKQGQRITSERSAKALEFQYLSEYQDKLEGIVNEMLFSDWHKKFLEDIRLTYKRSTVMQYDGDLKKWLPEFFSSKKITEITKSDIHSLVFEYLPREGASANLQRKIKRVLSRIFEAAMEESLISKNPCKGISVKVPPPEQLVLNTQEAEKLLEAAREVNHNFYYLWAFALLSGLRNGELYALCWKNIDEVKGIIKVSGQWTNKDGLHSTKTNRNRIVPISNALKELLVELKSLGPYQENLTGLNGNNQFVDDLILPRSSEWKHGEQSRITKKFCETIGITQVCFHDLRATFITNLLAQGVPLAKVMSIVGHSRTSTTDVYLRLAGVNVKGATDMLGYSLPKPKKDNVVSLFGGE